MYDTYRFQVHVVLGIRIETVFDTVGTLETSRTFCSLMWLLVTSVIYIKPYTPVEAWIILNNFPLVSPAALCSGDKHEFIMTGSAVFKETNERC